MTILGEQLITLREAAQRFPGGFAGCDHPHVDTVRRWALRGLRGVKLETIRPGHQRYTSVQAVERFIKALNEPSPDTTITMEDYTSVAKRLAAKHGL